MTTHTLRGTIEPYDIRTASEADYCEWCEQGADIEGAHAHEYFVSRDGATSRTADNLAAVFLSDVADLTTYVVPSELPFPDSSEWCDDSDDSEALSDEIANAESALSDVGLFASWDDGYTIQRIVAI